jgi:hypothetical protein
LEFSCIVAKTANKEKPSGPTFGEGILSCVKQSKKLIISSEDE